MVRDSRSPSRNSSRPVKNGLRSKGTFQLSAGWNGSVSAPLAGGPLAAERAAATSRAEEGRSEGSWTASRPAQSSRPSSTAFDRGRASDPFQERREVLTVYVLHRNEMLALGLDDVIDPADVRMADLASDPHFVEKAPQPGFVVDPLGEELEGDTLAELEVVGTVDLAHSAAAQHVHDAITAAQNRAGREPLASGRRRSCGPADRCRGLVCG